MHARAGNAPLIPAYLALNCNSNSLTLRAARRLSTYASQVLATAVVARLRRNCALAEAEKPAILRPESGAEEQTMERVREFKVTLTPERRQRLEVLTHSG